MRASKKAHADHVFGVPIFGCAASCSGGTTACRSSRSGSSRGAFTTKVTKNTK